MALSGRGAGALLALTVASCVSALSAVAFAQEPDAELEAGAVLEQPAGNAAAHVGPSLAFEFTPIEHWLELEGGVSRFRIDGATGWDMDLGLRTPFELSPSTEVLIGVGPTWTHTNAPGERASSFGGELSVDFQFWRSRRSGWYLETGYAFDRGERAWVLAAGVLLGLR